MKSEFFFCVCEMRFLTYPEANNIFWNQQCVWRPEWSEENILFFTSNEVVKKQRDQSGVHESSTNMFGPKDMGIVTGQHWPIHIQENPCKILDCALRICMDSWDPLDPWESHTTHFRSMMSTADLKRSNADQWRFPQTFTDPYRIFQIRRRSRGSEIRCVGSRGFRQIFEYPHRSEWGVAKKMFFSSFQSTKNKRKYATTQKFNVIPQNVTHRKTNRSR